MQYIERHQERIIQNLLKQFPVVILLGPRQVGKSTLSQHIIQNMPSLYLDLDRRKDRNLLTDPEAFWQQNKGKLIILDEIQLMPDFFGEIRSFVDEDKKPGQFLLLGSASRDLLISSSQTLAGRSKFLEIYPFGQDELPVDGGNLLWLRGGLPLSYLASNSEQSFLWRESYIQSFLYRDLISLGFPSAPAAIEKLWHMCAHLHGQLLNASKIGSSLGVSYHTIHKYLEWLEGTFVLRLLKPYHLNSKKRLIKSPKIYVRDSGLLHALLDIVSANDLLSHPIRGASFEGFIIEQLIQKLPLGATPYFYRTSYGSEIDLIVKKSNRIFAFEIKVSSAPKVPKGFLSACEDIHAQGKYIIAPVEKSYPVGNDVQIINLKEALEIIKNI